MRRMLLAVGCLALASAWGREEPSRLEFRGITRDRLDETGTPMSRDAVKVFAYEGAPVAMRVTGSHIEVDYQRSQVLFDRASGKPVRRVTVADGWSLPERRKPKDGLVDAGESVASPGVYCGGWYDRVRAILATATFDGRVWRATQPTTFLRDVDRAGWEARKKKYGTWTAILTQLNEVSRVEATPGAGLGTMAGLASNIVTRFAVADGALWAACVDIYDPARKEWGPGGLCRRDPKSSRWQRLSEIAGRPARWVTLLQAVGDDLWVGFREGAGVAGDFVVYGMGIYPGEYRPVAQAIVVARLSKGKWSVFSRPPLPNPPHSGRGDEKEQEAPTEKPVCVGGTADGVILFSRVRSQWPFGSWEATYDGCVSLLDTASGEWRHLDAERDFGADKLKAMVAENGETLVASNRGVHRWDAAAGAWRLLDPQCALRNPGVTAIAQVGDEAWIAYGKEGFGVIGEQGISRYNEKTGAWSCFPTRELGTSCPVHRMAALPGGDVWVLFRRRETITAAAEFPRYAREEWHAPEGLGRFHGGKWAFPMMDEKTVVALGRIDDLVAAGGKLFIASWKGVYAGPEPWTRVVEAPAERLSLSDDGNILLAACQDPKRPDGHLTLVRYYPDSGAVKWGANPEQPEHLAVLTRDAREDPEPRWSWEWVHVPTSRPGQWAVGPMRSDNRHWRAETPSALWIASHGELVRLDRARLADWLRQ